MSTTAKKTKTQSKKSQTRKIKGLSGDKAGVEKLFGRIVSFNNALKLYHWHISGPGSYARHIALDQAIGDLLGTTDRIIETTYSMAGDLTITIPETQVPLDIIKYAADFYAEMEESRILFTESYTEAIIDDYQEAVQQLLYRLRRLQ